MQLTDDKYFSIIIRIRVPTSNPHTLTMFNFWLYAIRIYTCLVCMFYNMSTSPFTIPANKNIT